VPWIERQGRLARSDGPETSRAAARQVAPKLSGLRARVLDLVREHPGCTATELAHHAGDGDPRRVNRRLPELVRDGLLVRGPARPCLITGLKAHTYHSAHPAHPAT
jgi:hypothetical protein